MGIAVANASMSTVRDMVIPMSPIELQEAYAEKMQFTLRLSMSHDEASRMNEKLFHSVLEDAFAVTS